MTRLECQLHTNVHLFIAQTTELPLKHPVYAGCGDLKGCFGYPDSCVTTQDCSMLVTYSNLSSALFEFEIFGSASTNSYVAVAFSTDRKMVRNYIQKSTLIEEN